MAERWIAVLGVLLLLSLPALALPAPAGLTATPVSGGIRLRWNAVPDADHYDVLRRSAPGAFTFAGTATTNELTDATVSSGTAYLYVVRAVDGGGVPSSDSNAALASTTGFDDDPLIPRLTTGRAAHVTQLRSAVNAVRALADLSPASWSESSIAGVPMRGSHLLELRNALDPARTILGAGNASYTNALTAGTPIRAEDVEELRRAIAGAAVAGRAPFWRSGLVPTGVQTLAATRATIYAGTASGVERSANGGDSWSAANTGLTNTDVETFAIAPSGALYAGTAGGGVFISSNGGDSWTLRSAMPTTPAVLLAATAGVFAGDCSGIYLLPYDSSSWMNRGSGVSGCVTALMESEGKLFAGTATAGVFASTNDGISWSPSSTGIGSSNIHALAADRDGALFAAAHDAGIHRSQNGGTAWTQIAAADASVLLAESSGELLAGTEGGASLLHSADAGTTFAASSGLGSGTRVNALAENGRWRFAAVDGRLFRASAGYRLHGLDFSPYIDDQDPNDLIPVPASQILARMKIAQPHVKWIRTFGSTYGLEKSGVIAHGLGLEAALGAWIGDDPAANEIELANLIQSGLRGDADLLIVGSEALLRGDVDEPTLLGYINRVKAAVPGVPVGYADVYGQLLAHPNVVAAIDVVLPNYYPYWESIAVNSAVAAVHGWHQAIVAAADGKPVIVSETGWPSAGAAQGDAVPSPENAALYFLNFVSWARENRVDFFYFEAFDEAWKAQHEGPQGAHWGVWDAGGVLKAGMADVLDGATMEDNWSGTAIPGGPGTPEILFTSVPPYGSFANLQGQVWHVSPATHRVAVYIYVGGWWTKPTFATPQTTILPNGSWTCDITTGGSDQNATKIAAFLIPSTYAPPAMSGGQTFPPELAANALASVEVTRSP